MEDNNNDDYSTYNDNLRKDPVERLKRTRIKANERKEKVVRYVENGQEKELTFPISETFYEGGTKVTQEFYKVTESGEAIANDDLAGVSWTGRQTPAGKLLRCINPFGLHDDYPERYFYDGIDGKVSDKGNGLCAECLEKQKKRIDWGDRCLWIFYRPTIY